MTVPEQLNAHPAAIHPSRRRALARNAEVGTNSDHDSDHDRDNAGPKMQNRPQFIHRTGVRLLGGFACRQLVPAYRLRSDR